MCLATVYKDSDDTVICRNVSKLTVEEDAQLKAALDEAFSMIK